MRGILTIGTLSLIGCGRIAFDPRTDATAIADIAVDAPPCTASFEPPSLEPILNSPQRDWAPAVSDDGLTLYFSSNRTGNEELYRAIRADLTAPWQPPTPITELAMAGDEEENPAPAADELELYWGGSRVWRASRTNRSLPFGPRSTVVSPVAGLFNNPQGPHIAPDHRTLYFTGTTPNGQGEDMFVVTRVDPTTTPFDETTSQELSTLNTNGNDGWPSLTADELVIVYVTDVAGSLELMTATRMNKSLPFEAPRVVAELNSSTSDEDPGISSDGRTLWFASTRPGGQGDYDIYVATRDCP